MKKIAPVIVTFLLVAVIAIITISLGKKQKVLTIYEGNLDRQPVPIILGHYQDTQCAMFIEQIKDAAQAVAPDGRTWFFDDVGCLMLWQETNKLRAEMILWVYTRDTEEWVDARTAWYSRTDDTPMEYGFGAYQNWQDGLIDYHEVSLRMLRGDNLTNPYTRKELLGHD